MSYSLDQIINSKEYNIDDDSLRAQCRTQLEASGVVVLPEFMSSYAKTQVCQEGEAQRDRAFYSTDKHNVFLKPHDPNLPAEHPRNRLVESSKGCITDDIVPPDSPLKTLYHAQAFKSFLCAILRESQLFEYADPLSSINLHYAANGQQLGWHFDNSSFAVTLLLQAPEAGGEFEYVNNVRDADRGDMNYEGVGQVLDGETATQTLSVDPGSLILFRGRNAMHRVTPVKGARKRMLVVFAYNSQPGVELSESARMTFYGRLS